ncbi:thiol peroxidase [Mycoplasma phocoeninasale]|uniref:thiol peroxidase n=1 Tax=Mycoplasma phocoeninasale TaxID=2726117 RepID=UPI00196797EA|nr:thiol peroxidase [Mycoplasma phocoeninasale]MBN0970737.1 thiol peroxidase [Mycoplasma phocoeninasale]
MKIKFKNQQLNLLGEQLKKGDIFPIFKAVNIDMSDFDSSQLNGKRRLFFSIPSIDSSVCEIETLKFMDRFKESNCPIVAISYDTPFAFRRWCAAKNNDKVITLSEFRYNDFGKKTGTRVEELGILTRAVFVVNENDKVEYVEYVNEITNEPNYEEVLKYFK